VNTAPDSSTATSAGETAAVAPRPRVFLVDDHPLFVAGLSKVLAADGELEVCGHAPSTREALSKLRLVRADLVITDLSLTGTNGLELIKHLKTEHPTLPILVMSIHDEREYAPRALRAGASGYLLKTEEAETLVAAVRKVLAGEIVVSAAQRQRMISNVVRPGGGSPLDAVTDRELEVLQLVGEGHTTSAIADRLNLSVKTVESHRLHLKDKLGLATSALLVRYAIAWVAEDLGGPPV
jgi:DNA-binding NarL/FixJ family response regulator